MKRFLRNAAALIAGVCVSGCVTPLQPSRAAALPGQVRTDPTGFVVVTVRNDARMRTARPGSTPRGYDSVSTYGVGGEASAAVRGLERDFGLRKVSAWPITSLQVHCIVFSVPVNTTRATLMGQLSRDSRVESVQALNEFAAQTEPNAHQSYNDPYAPLQHSLSELAVVQAQQRSRGTGVRIAIIDTGVDFAHPDLAGRVVVRRNFVDGDEQSFRRDRHGTQVAGVIAAGVNNGIGIAGIAPEAHLLVFKACWQRDSGAPHAVCNSFTLAQALEAAISEHVNLVNLSLAGPADPLLTRLLRRGMQDGIGFVGAVAPRGVVAGFPSEVDGVFAVESAEDSSGNPRHLLAPGHDVLTLVPDSHYDFASGSSLATAEVSGILALLLAQNPHLSLPEAHEILLRSSRGVQTPGGMLTAVNAQAALEDVLALGSCRSAGNCVAAAHP